MLKVLVLVLVLVLLLLAVSRNAQGTLDPGKAGHDASWVNV